MWAARACFEDLPQLDKGRSNYREALVRPLSCPACGFMRTSDIFGFYKKSKDERLGLVKEFGNVSDDESRTVTTRGPWNLKS